jgi:transcriptional regulator with XRE-family HTH domain
MSKSQRRSPDKEDIEIGFRIRKTRQDQKISLDEVAREISVSTHQLRKYELGRNKISARRLGKIATFLGVTSDYLIGINTEGKKYRRIDREMEKFWMCIDNPEHKRIILSVTKVIAEGKIK